MALLGAIEPAIAAQPTPVRATSRGLSFGTFAAAYTGTLTLTPEGARLGTGGVVPVSQVPGAPGELRLILGADKGAAPWRVTTPKRITLRNAEGSEMVVDSFTCRILPPTPFGSDRLSRKIKVGATLHVGEDQAPGNYTGSFSTIVEYE